MIVRDATPQDVAYVLSRLRPHCERELLATRPANVTRSDLFNELVGPLAQFVILRAALCSSAGDPVAIFTAYRASPVVGAFQTFSTADWPLVARPVIRWFNRAAVAQLRLAGIRMAECDVLDTPDFNERWFALMNLRVWGKPLPRGRNGELYRPMVWLPSGSATVDGPAAPLVSATT